MTATTGAATFSDCGRYRYTLTRDWSDGPRAVWVMLNPSTADGDTDDQTIRRCVYYSKRGGCGGLTVVNLFALRATDPKALRLAADPIGPENDDILMYVLAQRDVAYVVAAWGAHPFARRRSARVLGLIHGYEHEPYCLGTTKDRFPRHPSRLGNDVPLVRFGVS